MVFVSSITNSSAKTAAQNQVVPKDSKEWGETFWGLYGVPILLDLKALLLTGYPSDFLPKTAARTASMMGGLTCAANADGA